MRKYWKQSLSLLMVGAMAVGMAPAAAAANSDDISGHWSEKNMRQFVEAGYLFGYEDGSYRPDTTMSRAQFMAIINRIAGLTELSDKVSQYTDVDKDKWYYKDVAKALAAGYVTGDSATIMAPDRSITRQEAFVMVAQLIEKLSDEETALNQFKDAADVADWAKDETSGLVEGGYVVGFDGYLKPKDNLTRAEGVTLLQGMLEEIKNALNDDDDEEGVYVLMNIPYGEFYEADVNNSVPVDGVTSATKNKTRTGTLVGGSYHVNSDGTDITGITFPVYVSSLEELADYKQVTDSDSVEITVTNRGQTTTTEYKGKEALFQNPSYSYYVLSETPSYYKEMTVEDGEISFGAVVGEVTTVKDATAELTTQTTYGDYQVGVDGLPLESSDTVYAVVLSTKEGDSYGLRHLENVWRVTELAWCTGFTTAVHNCPTSSAHYEKMMGQTINQITYYTNKGIYTLDTNLYVPVKFEGTVSVENALVSAGSTKVDVSALPADYQAEYSVAGLEATVTNGVLTYPTAAAPGSYTLTVSDKGGKYADVTATFVLSTDKSPVGYDVDNSTLVPAEGYSKADVAAYVKNIQSVSVDGKSYASTGRGSVAIINEDGSIKLDAVSGETAIFTVGSSYQVVVTATGYPDMTFQVEVPVYVLMNIPYDAFYAAEVSNSVPVDGVTSATMNKTRTGTLVGGSYHVNSDGTDITGITFPVRVTNLAALASYKEVKDTDSVSITVTNRGQTTTTEYKGKEALFQSPSYSYYMLSEVPSYYKNLTVADGKFSFGAVVGEVTKVDGASAELTTQTTYGDYQVGVDGLPLESSDTVYAVVLSTKEGDSYGLRHLENVWRVTELAWCTGFTTAVHNCPTSSAHYEKMMGQTINQITYYTSKGIYTLDTNLYVPVKFEGAVSVENALVSAGSTKVDASALPADYQAEYSVAGLEATVSNGVLTYSNTAAPGSYTLTVSDKGGKYANVTATFVLSTETAPVSYDANNLKLVGTEGSSEADLAVYLKNITSVSVDGKSYAASGRGSVVIINEDGSVKADAAPFAEGESFAVVVSSTGYPDVAFTYSKYTYLYAALTWQEYWASESVYAAGSTNSAEGVDAKGESDLGAFDAVTRATTNHGLHRGNFQCSTVIYDTEGNAYPMAYWADQSTIILTDGTSIGFSRGTITKADGTTATMDHYVVNGIKYVPVKVLNEDLDAFKAAYQVVLNGEQLAGGYSENQLAAYTALANVDANTNGLKTVTKNEDGAFSFSARQSGTTSGIAESQLKTVDPDTITVTVKEANGSYGEFLRVDLTGDGYGALGAKMQAVVWTYYGSDSTYTTPIATYGTKFAADNWMHKSMGIQLGLTNSLRCQLPENTDGTGYWTITVYALGYEDFTVKIQATDENIVKPAEEEVDTSALEALIAQAQALEESNYTADSWSAMKAELDESVELLASEGLTQAMVDEQIPHLRDAIAALVAAPTTVTGTYTGSATTTPDEYNDFSAYDIKVTVTVANNKITGVAFASNIDADNQTYANRAMTSGRGSTAGLATQLTGQDITGELKVDAVTQATCSSKAILAAVKDAVAQIG